MRKMEKRIIACEKADSILASEALGFLWKQVWSARKRNDGWSNQDAFARVVISVRGPELMTHIWHLQLSKFP